MPSKEKRGGVRAGTPKLQPKVHQADPHTIATFRWLGRDGALWLCLIFTSAIYYYWTANPTNGEMLHSHYTVLTDAFLFHQTHLRIDPDPRLLALPDPYDPVQNAPYRLHDTSLYKGKYYVYFGPAPVVLLFVPYMRLQHEFLSDGLAAYLFAVWAYAIASLLLKLILETWWPQTSRLLYFLLCAFLLFSNSFPILLRRAAAYEVAIAAGQFFALLGLYALLRSALGRPSAIVFAGLGGAAIGAAFGSRPQTVLAIAAVAWLLLLGRQIPLRVRLTRLIAALVPFAACAALVLWYNYIRFDSPLEFGTHYQLAGINVRKMQYFSLARMFPNLWFSLLQPPHLESTFPFVSLNLSLLPHPPARTNGFDPMTGIVWLVPLVLVLGAAPMVWKRLHSSQRRDWLVGIATLAGLGAAWVAVDDMLGVTMRYQADCATALFLAAVFVVPGLSGLRPWAKVWMPRAVVALGLFGAAMSAALGIQGNENGLYQVDRRQFDALATVFTPVSKVLSWIGVKP
jgi:hypothetical protein